MMYVTSILDAKLHNGIDNQCMCTYVGRRAYYRTELKETRKIILQNLIPLFSRILLRVHR